MSVTGDPYPFLENLLLRKATIIFAHKISCNQIISLYIFYILLISPFGFIAFTYPNPDAENNKK